MSNTSSIIFANASASFVDDNAYAHAYGYNYGFENTRGFAYDRDFTDNPVTSVLFGYIFIMWCALEYVRHMKKMIKSRSWISAADVYVQLATTSAVIGTIFDTIKKMANDNKKTIRRLKKKNRQMKSIIAVTEQQLESYKDERDELWTEYDTMHAKMQRIEGECAKVSAEFGEEYRAMVKERNELQQKIVQIEEEKLALSERIDSLDKCNNTLQCQLCELAAQLADKEKRKAEKRSKKKKQCRTIIDEEEDEEEDENHAAL